MTPDDNVEPYRAYGYYELYTYDAEGRQTEVTKPQYLDSANPAEPVVTKTVYYEDGEADGDEGQVEYVIFNYDSSTWNENKSGQTGTTNVQFEFTYDEDGSRALCVYPSGMVKDFNAEAAEPEETPVEYDITYSYNAESNVATVTRPEGDVDYSYEGYGSLGSIRYFGHTVNYSYDFFGRLERAVAPLGEWNYQYNDVGLKSRVENTTTGDVESRTYDALGRLDTLVHIDDNADVVFSQDFDVASDGTRTGVLETRGSTDVQWDYEYDELGRLVAERRDADDDSSYEYEVEYSYDVDSNRTSEYFKHTSTTRSYVYEANSQRLSQIKIGSTVREAFTWTTDGEQATHTWYDASGVEEKKQTYTWGVFDTLTQVDFHEWNGADWDYQGKLAYTYDDSNTLIRRQQYDQYDDLQDDVKYLVDTQNLTGYSQVLAEIDGQTNQLRRLNTYADEIKAEQLSNSSATSYLHNDALGSIRGLTGTNSSGSPLSESYNYTAFGSPFVGDDGDRSLTNYAFTGQVRDDASGLQYHRARWLNTDLGQWLSVDPVFDFPLNFGGLYGYVGGSPASHTDRSGHFSMNEMTAATAAMLVVNSIFLYNDIVWLGQSVADGTPGQTALATAFIILDLIAIFTGIGPLSGGMKMAATSMATSGGLTMRVGRTLVWAPDAIELSIALGRMSKLSLAQLIRGLWLAYAVNAAPRPASPDLPLTGRKTHSDKKHHDEGIRLAKFLKKHLDKLNIFDRLRIRYNQPGVDIHGNSIRLRPDILVWWRGKDGSLVAHVIEICSKKQSRASLLSKRENYAKAFGARGMEHGTHWEYWVISRPKNGIFKDQETLRLLKTLGIMPK